MKIGQCINTAVLIVLGVAASLFAAVMVAVITLPDFGVWLVGGGGLAKVLAIDGSPDRLWVVNLLVILAFEPILALVRRTTNLNKDVAGFLGFVLGILNFIYVVRGHAEGLSSLATVLVSFVLFFYYTSFWAVGTRPPLEGEEKKQTMRASPAATKPPAPKPEATEQKPLLEKASTEAPFVPPEKEPLPVGTRHRHLVLSHSSAADEAAKKGK